MIWHKEQGLSQSEEQLQAQMRAAMNLIAADQAALRLTLQSLILSLFGAQREAALRLMANMKQQVVESLRHMPTNEKDPVSTQRARDLHVSRAELLFKELEQALGNSGERPNREAQ
jgi:hypothetical protein